jgi:putative ABC transport system permease protein
MTVLLKSRGATKSAAGAVREELRALDPTVPMLDTKTLRGSMDAALIIINIVSAMFAVFGVSAVLLAAIGLYGVISFAVSQRTREIGIRMAIGAKRRQIFNLILRQGLILVLIGLPIGLGLGIALNRALAAVLPISPGTSIVWFTTLSALAATAVFALLFPAWKATNVEPMEALRHD